MPSEPVLLARLARDRERVLCGVLDCGGKLADIYRPTPYDIEEAHEAGEELWDNLYFQPGWAPRDDGVWAFSKYAMKHYRKGGTIKFRRTPPEVLGFDEVSEGPIETLPVRAKCSKCDFTNTLSRDVLNVRHMTSLPWFPVKN